MNKVLLVDDDKDILEILKIYFSSSNFDVYTASDGEKALDIIDSTFDIVLLDIMMPNLNGYETLKKIRENNNIPVMFISAKTKSTDKFEGLMLGADDYITKPFDPQEVITKANVLIRRYKVLGSKSETLDNNNEVIKINNIEVIPNEYKVIKNNETLKLTKTEFSILNLLVSNKGIVFNNNQINDVVFEDPNSFLSGNSIAVHIKNLRDKIEDDPKNPKIILNVWGVGYKVEK